jgi:hypothetical protein
VQGCSEFAIGILAERENLSPNCLSEGDLVQAKILQIVRSSVFSLSLSHKFALPQGPSTLMQTTHIG